MTSHTTNRFRKALQQLPPHIQRQARAAYRLWQQNPGHKSLHFKQVHASRSIYSVRIGLGWRALGVKREDEMIWFWIGSHADYDKLLSQL
jgi:hypothetical protein